MSIETWSSFTCRFDCTSLSEIIQKPKCLTELAEQIAVRFLTYLAFNETIPLAQDVSWKKTLLPKFGFFVAVIISGNSWMLNSSTFTWFEKHFLAIRSLLSDHKLIVITIAIIVKLMNSLYRKCCFMNADTMKRTIYKIKSEKQSINFLSQCCKLLIIKFTIKFRAFDRECKEFNMQIAYTLNIIHDNRTETDL